jgi:hypothetical protein
LVFGFEFFLETRLCYAEPAGPELWEAPASASQVLGLQA